MGLLCNLVFHNDTSCYVCRVRHAADGPGLPAEAYTAMLQKSMTPYVTTQVSY